MGPIIAILLIIVNIPVYKVFLRLFFKDSQDINDSIRYSFTPDLFSLFRGNYRKDKIGEAKLSLFIFSCIFVVVIEFLVLNWIIGLIQKAL
jgi:hypothetical protein